MHKIYNVSTNYDVAAKNSLCEPSVKPALEATVHSLTYTTDTLTISSNTLDRLDLLISKLQPFDPSDSKKKNLSEMSSLPSSGILSDLGIIQCRLEEFRDDLITRLHTLENLI